MTISHAPSSKHFFALTGLAVYGKNYLSVSGHIQRDGAFPLLQISEVLRGGNLRPFGRQNAVLVEGESSGVTFSNLAAVLAEPDTQLRLFGKPNVSGQRRMAVTLARGADVNEARAKAHKAASAMQINL